MFLERPQTFLVYRGALFQLVPKSNLPRLEGPPSRMKRTTFRISRLNHLFPWEPRSSVVNIVHGFEVFYL